MIQHASLNQYRMYHDKQLVSPPNLEEHLRKVGQSCCGLPKCKSRCKKKGAGELETMANSQTDEIPGLAQGKCLRRTTISLRWQTDPRQRQSALGSLKAINDMGAWPWTRHVSTLAGRLIHGMTFVPVMRRSAWVLPPLWLACMIGTLLYGSKLAAAFLAVTVAAAYLPPGKVSCPPTSIVQ